MKIVIVMNSGNKILSVEESASTSFSQYVKDAFDRGGVYDDKTGIYYPWHNIYSMKVKSDASS